MSFPNPPRGADPAASGERARAVHHPRRTSYPDLSYPVNEAAKKAGQGPPPADPVHHDHWPRWTTRWLFELGADQGEGGAP